MRAGPGRFRVYHVGPRHSLHTIGSTDSPREALRIAAALRTLYDRRGHVVELRDRDQRRTLRIWGNLGEGWRRLSPDGTPGRRVFSSCLSG